MVPNHDPKQPELTLPDGNKVRMEEKRAITMVQIMPPKKPVVNSTLINEETPEFWHLRTMHVAEDKLHHMGVIGSHQKVEACNTCMMYKPKIRVLKLEPEKKEVPTKKLELVAYDLLVPAANQKGVMLMCIDIATGYTVAEYYSMPSSKLICV